MLNMPICIKILKVKIFDLWRIDFGGTFPPSNGNEYALMVGDYVSKWAEVIPTGSNGHQVVVKFTARNFFAQFECTWVIISDEGSHFTNAMFQPS